MYVYPSEQFCIFFLSNLFCYICLIVSYFDLSVDFQGVGLYEYADNCFGSKESLERLFKRDVDLLDGKAFLTVTQKSPNFVASYHPKS